MLKLEIIDNKSTTTGNGTIRRSVSTAHAQSKVLAREKSDNLALSIAFHAQTLILLPC